MGFATVVQASLRYLLNKSAKAEYPMEVPSLLLRQGWGVPFLTLACVRLLTAIRKDREESSGSCSQPGFLQGINYSSSARRQSLPGSMRRQMSRSPSRPVFSGAECWVLFLSFKGRAILREFLKSCPMPNDSV